MNLKNTSKYIIELLPLSQSSQKVKSMGKSKVSKWIFFQEKKIFIHVPNLNFTSKKLLFSFKKNNIP